MRLAKDSNLDFGLKLPTLRPSQTMTSEGTAVAGTSVVGAANTETVVSGTNAAVPPSIFVSGTSVSLCAGATDESSGKPPTTVGEIFNNAWTSRSTPTTALGPNVVAIPKVTVSVDRFVALQKWEGIVTSVTDDAFVAQLRDLKNPGEPIEEAEIYRSELSADDIPLLTPGAVFYWSIGYLDSRFGQRTKQSSIRFRRLPAWTPADLAAAKADAENLTRAFSFALGHVTRKD